MREEGQGHMASRGCGDGRAATREERAATEDSLRRLRDSLDAVATAAERIAADCRRDLQHDREDLMHAFAWALREISSGSAPVIRTVAGSAEGVAPQVEGDKSREDQ